MKYNHLQAEEAFFMSVELNNEYGQIDISNDVIAQIAGGVAIECQGIVGMASKNQIRDGLTDILGKDNFSRGVIVRVQDQKLQIDMYVIVGYGIKISELAYEVQLNVKNTIKQILGFDTHAINIYVQSVRVTTN